MSIAAAPLRTEKPPYRVPTMQEIRALPWNGLNVASTFSGGGGSALGYRMAGCRVLYSNEFVPAARETYRANAAPYTYLDDRDVREVTAEDILGKMGLSVGELDIFDGSPPCASFSTAGKRHEGWGTVKKYSDTEQRSDDLFFEYVRLIQGMQPKTFVAENVSGLVKGTAKGYFMEIIRALKACGYRVDARLLDSQWLGVPQARQRVIFVGVRNDLGLPPVHPDPLPYRYTVRDVFPYIAAQGDNGGFGKGSMRPANKPSPTIGAGPTTGNGRFPPSKIVTRDGETRKLTLAELRLICGFPEDFVLAGTFAQGWERLGRAVPPVMMSHVAAAVRDRVLTPYRQQQENP